MKSMPVTRTVYHTNQLRRPGTGDLFPEFHRGVNIES
jgi:hypothetical protein